MDIFLDFLLVASRIVGVTYGLSAAIQWLIKAHDRRRWSPLGLVINALEVALPLTWGLWPYISR